MSVTIDSKILRSAVRDAVLMSLSPWRSKTEAARYLDVSCSYLGSLARAGKLPKYVNESGSVRFKVEDLDRVFKKEIHE